MPPRKRTQSAPKPEETDEQTAEAVPEDEPGADEAPAEAADAGDDGTGAEDPPADPDESDDKPERSDIQAGEPCSQCFAGGWAAQADTTGGLGCEHGTWQRDPAN